MGEGCLLEAARGHVARVESQNHPPNKQRKQNGRKCEEWPKRLFQMKAVDSKSVRGFPSLWGWCDSGGGCEGLK